MRFYSSIGYDLIKSLFLFLVFVFILVVGYNNPITKGYFGDILIFTAILSAWLLLSIVYKIFAYRIKYYELTDNYVAQKIGFFKDFNIIRFNRQLMLNTKQNLFNYLTNTITVEIEADMDKSSPELVLKNVPVKYYNILMEKLNAALSA